MPSRYGPRGWQDRELHSSVACWTCWDLPCPLDNRPAPLSGSLLVVSPARRVLAGVQKIQHSWVNLWHSEKKNLRKINEMDHIRAYSVPSS